MQSHLKPNRLKSVRNFAVSMRNVNVTAISLVDQCVPKIGGNEQWWTLRNLLERTFLQTHQELRIRRIHKPNDDLFLDFMLSC